MTRTTYAISTGEYADYRVLFTFSTEEGRDTYLKKYLLLEPRAFGEAFDLDPAEPEIAKCVMVYMSHGREVDFIGPDLYNIIEALGFQFYGRRRLARRGYGYHEKSIVLPVIAWLVQTDNYSHAIEVVSKKRAQIIAAGLWWDTEATKSFFNLPAPADEDSEENFEKPVQTTE